MIAFIIDVALVDEVKGRGVEFEENFANRQVDALVQLYSEDCYFMEPGVFTVSGRDGEQ